MAIPAANTGEKRVSPPSMAAASAFSMSWGPSAWDSASGRVGPMRMADTPASSPAAVHTANDTLSIGTPARRAASVFSAAARLALPSRLRPRNSAKAIVRIGTATRMVR